MSEIIPVVLFGYARPSHLARTLGGLRNNNVPLIYAFADGPRTLDKRPATEQVREILRAVDWCEVVLVERNENLGLGRSILTGVTDVLQRYDCAIVFEDDLICVPGAYDYLCAALSHYRDENKVMSVTAWTHPRVTPRDIVDQPYFDGRAECWAWGTWARAWDGMMENDAKMLMQKCAQKGIDIYRYGADLPAMAEVEHQKNIWAVRFLYWHILNQGLCLRPPWSMIEHIGFDDQATNASGASQWANPPLKSTPLIPTQWPEPVEHSELPVLWQAACGVRPSGFTRLYRFVRRMASTTLRAVSNEVSGLWE